MYLPNEDGAPTTNVELSVASIWLWNKLREEFNLNPSPGLAAQMDLVMHDGDVLSALLKFSEWADEAKRLLKGYYK